MSKYLIADHETIELGYDSRINLYLREGYLADKVVITPAHDSYEKLVSLLGDEKFTIFLKRDIEFKFLKDIFVAESTGGV